MRDWSSNPLPATNLFVLHVSSFRRAYFVYVLWSSSGECFHIGLMVAPKNANIRESLTDRNSDSAGGSLARNTSKAG